jgi:hypothetical protein
MLDHAVEALAVFQGRVVAGGRFTQVDSFAAHHLAWTVNDHWEGVPGAPDGPVSALLVAGEALVVGGDFTAVGPGLAAARVARFDGTAWSTLGTLEGTGVDALALYRDEVVAGGTPFGVARLDGSTWRRLGSIGGWCTSLAPAGDQLLAGGVLFLEDPTEPVFAARFDGTRWYAQDAGLVEPVRAMAWWRGRPVAGGAFCVERGSSVDRLAVWDEGIWRPFPGGSPDDRISSLAATRDALVAGGSFLSLDALGARYLAAYGAGGWASLPRGADTGFDDRVLCLHEEDGILYAAGWFLRAGGVEAPRVARWRR